MEVDHTACLIVNHLCDWPFRNMKTIFFLSKQPSFKLIDNFSSCNSTSMIWRTPCRVISTNNLTKFSSNLRCNFANFSSHHFCLHKVCICRSSDTRFSSFKNVANVILPKTRNHFGKFTKCDENLPNIFICKFKQFLFNICVPLGMVTHFVRIMGIVKCLLPYRVLLHRLLQICWWLFKSSQSSSCSVFFFMFFGVFLSF